MTEAEREARRLARKSEHLRAKQDALEAARDFRVRMAEAWREAEYPVMKRDAPL